MDSGPYAARRRLGVGRPNYGVARRWRDRRGEGRSLSSDCSELEVHHVSIATEPVGTSPPTAPSRKLKRSRGLWMATALVVGNMIGSGIFLLPSSLAAAGAAQPCRGRVGWRARGSSIRSDVSCGKQGEASRARRRGRGTGPRRVHPGESQYPAREGRKAVPASAEAHREPVWCGDVTRRRSMRRSSTADAPRDHRL